ncbi:MAG: disulfide bond formation protein B [Rhodobacteraceae bacterium]|nr:disulfide bond formation protein B [Paracoccaceae bacterium]
MKTVATPRVGTALLLIVGLIAIATAWGFQLIGGYVPCQLCLEQRQPYYVGLPLGLVALVLLSRGNSRAGGFVLLVVALVFAYGAGLGAYQAGAEWGFWLGPNDCGGSGSGPASASNMLQTLQSTRIVSCTEASWRLFGLSFAGWNAVASGAIALIAFLSGLCALKRCKVEG